MGKREHSNRQPWHVPAWEWAIAAVGAFLVLGMIGFMTYRAMHEGSPVPDLHVQARQVHARGGNFVVELQVRNDGGGATNVAIEGELVAGGTLVESASVTLDYVPARSRRQAGLIFSRDPRQHALRLRATGYQTP